MLWRDWELNLQLTQAPRRIVDLAGVKEEVNWFVAEHTENGSAFVQPGMITAASPALSDRSWTSFGQSTILPLIYHFRFQRVIDARSNSSGVTESKSALREPD